MNREKREGGNWEGKKRRVKWNGGLPFFEQSQLIFPLSPNVPKMESNDL